MVEPLIISLVIGFLNAEITPQGATSYSPTLKSDSSRIVKIRIWREPHRIILYCYLKNTYKELVESADWYRQNFSNISQVRGSENIKIFRQKLVLLNPNTDKSEKYFCKMKLLNGTQLLSEKISLNQLDDVNVESGNSLKYPSDGICKTIENFPPFIFLYDGQYLKNLENGILSLVSRFESVAPENKTMLIYFTHFLCYSQYTFFDKKKNTTFRIHHDDLMNIMYLIRESLLFPDDILIPALKIYNENKDSLVSKSGPNSIRIILSSFTNSNEMDCLSDNGVTYNGKINTTISGKPCIKWSKVALILQSFTKKDNDHNFCRNPVGNEDSPFCFIDSLTFEYCVIPQCSKIWFYKYMLGQPLLWLWVLILLNVLILGLFLVIKYNDKLIYFFHILFRGNTLENSRKVGTIPPRTTSYNLNRAVQRFISNNSYSGNDFDKTKNEFDYENARHSQISSLCASIALEHDVKESIWDGVPFIMLKSINLSFVEPFTSEIYKAQLKFGDFMNLSCSTRENFLKENMYLIVRSEDTSDMIIRRYLFENSNLFTLYGIVLESTVNDQFPYGLVYEFFPLFDVSQYLQTKSLQNWPRKLVELVDIFKQVTSAFCYLNGQKLVHADLALRNVFLVSLLTEDQLPKIKLGDFAKFRYTCEPDYLIINLDEFTNRTHITTKYLYLPIKWMAPEIIQSIVEFEEENQIIVRVQKNMVVGSISKIPGTFKSDIYSYGVLVWELFHDGKKPFDDITIDYCIRQIVKEQTPRLIQQKIKGSLAKFIDDCTNPRPALRPRIEEIEELSMILSASFNLENN